MRSGLRSIGMDLARLGFVIENDWYWKITEGARTFDALAAVRDFLAPLARHAKGKVAITDIAADVDEVRFVLANVTYAVRIYAGLTDRAATHHFVSDVDRALAATKTGYQFALVVPRRYELRGVLVTDAELATIAASQLLVPTMRPSRRTM